MILRNIRGLQEFSLLAIIARLGEARPPQVRELLEWRTGHAISHSHVPTTLAALEKKGLLSAQRIRRAGEREFRVYRLTRLGKEALDEAVAYLEAVITP